MIPSTLIWMTWMILTLVLSHHFQASIFADQPLERQRMMIVTATMHSGTFLGRITLPLFTTGRLHRWLPVHSTYKWQVNSVQSYAGLTCLQEFVERQTLKEVSILASFSQDPWFSHVIQRVAEGISEDEAWRLFQQIVDALVHMSALGIVSQPYSSPYVPKFRHRKLASSRYQTDKYIHR